MKAIRLIAACLLATVAGLSNAHAQTPDTRQNTCAYITHELLAEKAAQPGFGEDAKDLMAFYATRWTGSLLTDVDGPKLDVAAFEALNLPFAEVERLIQWVHHAPTSTSHLNFPELIYDRDVYKSLATQMLREAKHSPATTDDLLKRLLFDLGILKTQLSMGRDTREKIAALASKIHVALSLRSEYSAYLTPLISALLKKDGVPFEIKKVFLATEVGTIILHKIVILPRGNADISRVAASLAKNRGGEIHLVVQPDKNLALQPGSWSDSSREIAFSVDEIISGQYHRGLTFGHEFDHLMIDEEVLKNPNLAVWNFHGVSLIDSWLPLPDLSFYARAQSFSEIATYNFERLRLLEELERLNSLKKLNAETYLALTNQLDLVSETLAQVAQRTLVMSRETLRAIDAGGDQALLKIMAGYDSAKLTVQSNAAGGKTVAYEMLIGFPPRIIPADVPAIHLADPQFAVVKNFIYDSLRYFETISESYLLQILEQRAFLHKYPAPSSFADINADDLSDLISNGLDLSSPVPLREFADFARFPTRAH